MTVMTASAIDVPTYNLTVGTNDHGTVKFYVNETEVNTAAEGATVTVVITPNTGWVVNQPSGQWYAAVAAARSQRTASVDLLDKVTLTPVEGQTNQWTFTMARANVEISSTYKKLLTNTDITVQDITALTYSGVAQEPVVTVKDGQTVLTLGTDYTVAYSNNTNAALATAAQNAPTVTITALATSEKYSGETTKTFTINKKALTVKAEDKSVTFGDDAPTYTESYDGFVNNETKTVLSGTLAFACDYVKNQTAAGTYDITPSGLTSSNYDITFTKGTLTVGKKALEDGFIANIASLVYNGVAQEPAPVVTFNGMTLEKDVDYTVSYENNVNVGTATATVTALANSTKYSGSASKTFSITKKALTVKADNKKVTYGDDAPQYTVSYDGFVNNETKAVLSGTLSLTCSYVKNQSGAGTYDITPSGLTSANYDITFTKGTLTIRKKTLEDGFMSKVADLTYNGKAQEPAPTLTYDGITLVEGKDYVLSYINNKEVADATDAAAPVVTASAVKNSNYSGAATQKFNIKKAPLTVKAADVNIIHGSEVPEYEVSYEGFVAEETVAVLEGTLAVACDYTKESAVGSTYDITPSGLTAKNYDITFVPGKLTVLVDQAAVDQAAADNAMGKITAIGEVAYTEASKTLIDAAREAYDALTDAQKALVTNLETLTTAETTYDNLKAAAEKAAADKEAADAVIGKITAIGEVAYTPESKALIEAAREAYTALTEEQKALVTNLEVLTAAETTYDNLKAAAEKAAADQLAAGEVIDKIIAIGEVAYTPESKALIDAARNAYDALTADQKALVTNIEVLTVAERTYANLKAAAEKAAADKEAAGDVIDKIVAIGEVVYTEDCKALIDAARNAYNALTADQKALVTNLSVLTDAETAYAELAQIATGISTIKAIAGKTIYDMNGRKVTVPSKKGIYIINGKKVVMK